jgi:type IV pilus assembly protein PilA
MWVVGADLSSGSSIWLKLCVIVPVSFVGYVIWFSIGPGCSCANKAIQSEARTHIGSVNQEQQDYFLKNNIFVTTTSELDKLGLGIEPERIHYRYMISGINLPYKAMVLNLDSRSSQDDSDVKPKATISIAVTKKNYLKSYIGVVWTTPAVNTESKVLERTTRAILCEADKPGVTEFLKPIVPTETTKPDSWSSLFNWRTQSTPSDAKAGLYKASIPALSTLGEARIVSFDKDKNGGLQVFCPQGFKNIP